MEPPLAWRDVATDGSYWGYAGYAYAVESSIAVFGFRSVNAWVGRRGGSLSLHNV